MKEYEVMIFNEIGCIVLDKYITAESEEEAIQQVKENVILEKGDTIEIKERGK